MELNQITYAAIVALMVGMTLLFTSSKQRTEEGEWSGALQWGYLLLMVGIFGILASGLQWSFTAILLLFTVLTGILWAWAKWMRTDKKTMDNNHFRDYIAGFFPIIAIVFVLRTFVAEPFQIPSSSMRPGLVKGDFILVNKFAYGIRIPVLNSVLIPTGQVVRGDVAVFNYPLNPNVNYIKRIVGISGDVVEYKNKRLTVNGKVEEDSSAGLYQYIDDMNPAITRDAERFQAAFDGRTFEVLKEDNMPAVDMDALHKIMAHNPNRTEQQRACEYFPDGSGFKCTVPEGQYFAMGDNRDSSADSRYWGFVDDKLLVGKAFFIWFNWGEMKRVGSSIH